MTNSPEKDISTFNLHRSIIWYFIIFQQNERSTRQSRTMNYTYCGGKERKSEDSRSRPVEEMFLLPNLITKVCSAGPVQQRDEQAPGSCPVKAISAL